MSGDLLGMAPDEVDRLARVLHSSRGVLEHAAREANMAALVSLNPLTYGIQPGGLLLAPWAIGGTQVAAAKVRGALEAAEQLVGTLIAEAQQQREASGGGAGTNAGGGSRQRSVVPPVGVSAAELRAWWASLSEPQKASLIRDHPDWIANRDGIPFAARDQANRAILDDIIDDPATSPEAREAAIAIRKSIADGEKLMPGTPFQLTLLDLSDPDCPKAAISVGDSDAADYVSTIAYGINTDGGDTEDSLGAAINLQRETSKQLGGTGLTPATVMWLGYDSGDIATVTGDSNAILGAPAYSSYLDGIRAANPNATVVAVGHSYGTRMISYALSTGGTADAVILLASPGVGDSVTNASQLDVPPGQVYAGRAITDLVAGPLYRVEEGINGQGRPNPDPQDPRFGAHHIPIITNPDPLAGGGHNVNSGGGPGAYLGAGSSGARGTAQAIINARSH